MAESDIMKASKYALRARNAMVGSLIALVLTGVLAALQVPLYGIALSATSIVVLFIVAVYYRGKAMENLPDSPEELMEQLGDETLFAAGDDDDPWTAEDVDDLLGDGSDE